MTACSDFELNQYVARRLVDDDLRRELVAEVRAKKVWAFKSASHPEDDPAPPFSRTTPAGHRTAWLVAGTHEVAEALRDATHFSNAPYTEFGVADFMLAMDPVGGAGDDRHGKQRRYAYALLGKPEGAQLRDLADEAVRQASVAGLLRDDFDVASLAEQAALRYIGLAFGFSSKDHTRLQTAASAGYRALVHQIVGRHFSHDPTALPLSRQEIGRLTQRVSELIEAYRRVAWESRKVHGRLKHRLERARWPEDIDPPDEWGLSAAGDPLLKRMALEPGDFSVHELATIAVGLIVGTVGNVQASVCLVLRQFFDDDATLIAAIEASKLSAPSTSGGSRGTRLESLVGDALARRPPVAFLPRRAREGATLAGTAMTEGDDVILWLAAAGAGPKETPPAYSCAHALPFGLQEIGSPAPHACIGATAGRALITAIVGAVLRLPGIAEQLDPITGQRRELKQRWGFACESYPLTHRRAERLKQQPLNVWMRVKSPVDFHAEALRRIIRVGAPRIERALKESAHVHFAWFELLDQGRLLGLHTVYDGGFDAYIQHFALKVDDLFDQLFEHIEGAPPLPVGDHPGAFVDVIRAFNAAPTEGYFFSAYPTEVPGVRRQCRGDA